MSSDLFDGVDDTTSDDPTPTTTEQPLQTQLPLSIKTSLFGAWVLASMAFALFPLGVMLTQLPIVTTPTTPLGLYATIVSVGATAFLALELVRYLADNRDLLAFVNV